MHAFGFMEVVLQKMKPPSDGFGQTKRDEKAKGHIGVCLAVWTEDTAVGRYHRKGWRGGDDDRVGDWLEEFAFRRSRT